MGTHGVRDTGSPRVLRPAPERALKDKGGRTGYPGPRVPVAPFVRLPNFPLHKKENVRRNGKAGAEKGTFLFLPVVLAGVPAVQIFLARGGDNGDMPGFPRPPEKEDKGDSKGRKKGTYRFPPRLPRLRTNKALCPSLFFRRHRHRTANGLLALSLCESRERFSEPFFSENRLELRRMERQRGTYRKTKGDIQVSSRTPKAPNQ